MASKRRPLLWFAIPLVVVLGIFLMPRSGPSRVSRVTTANEELQAAAKEAQQSLPGFIDELKKAPAGVRFAVKGSFKTDSGPEYMWVKDPTYKNGEFTGILDQRPMVYKGAKGGDEVTVKKADVFDWLIVEGDKVRGRFTEDVLARQQD